MTQTLTSAPFRHHAGARDDAEKPPDIAVAASGNLAQISFPGVPGRATREAIDAAFPGLIDGLVRHPGIGLVMVHAKDHGPVVHGAGGTHDLTDGRVDGIDPLLIISMFDLDSGEVAPFEEQIGSHGGLGGQQIDAFILHPAEWGIEATPLGAVALHGQIRRWLRSSR